MREQFEKYYQIIEKLKRSTNSLWSKVSFISVAEVINSEVDLRELDQLCWNLKTTEMDSRREAYRKIESYPDDEYDGELEEIDNELDDLFRLISNKLDAVEVIIDSLKKIEEKSEEENYLDLFNDLSSIQLDESVSHIKLKRFIK
jgi:hypothetical protein